MKKFLAIIAAAALIAFAAPAFAANPFMDVPAGHWAYDAVEQLASRGIVSGYPDGAFKGPQPATRYEMASVVARALAHLDASKANKQDLEMLKKLVIEFKDELDALGVKVDKLDKRVAVLEKGVGGWTIAGEFRFDMKFEDDDANFYNLRGVGDTDFNVSRYRLHFTKVIDDKTYFYGRLNGEDTRWDRYFVNTKLPWDIDFRIGLFNFDWEGDAGLYTDDDATYGDVTAKGVQFYKDFGIFDATMIIARDDDFWTINNDTMIYALRLRANFNEKFRMGGMYYNFDDDVSLGAPYRDHTTFSLYAAYDFTPAVTLQGIYYWQTIERGGLMGDIDADSWKAQLILRQDLLKFTSLWIEYGREDAGFQGVNVRGGAFNSYGANPTFNFAEMAPNATASYFFVRADQQWNDKFSTFERYFKVDLDTLGLDDTTNWTLGIKYQYTPAMSFELAYDNIDYGTNNLAVFPTARSGEDHLIRLRTYVKF
jgi:predicted porin